MKEITYLIEQLLGFAFQKGLIGRYDIGPARNRLLDLLKLKAPAAMEDAIPVMAGGDSSGTMMKDILNYCAANRIIEDTLVSRDLMDARIMGELMPRASETINRFYTLYQETPEKATDYFYQLSLHSNYIQSQRIKKNLYWLADTAYGKMEITINLSKPEKDPKDIEKAKNAPATGYPRCLLCKENAGFAGSYNHPARQNLRLIPVVLDYEEWFMQYSPYAYYNEHCIVLSSAHTPMKITEATIKRLLDFIEAFPHYFIGSNADLPIVGGSILSHDHYQGGRHIFPMEKAPVEAAYSLPEDNAINIGRVCWPMAVIRISSADKRALSEVAWRIFCQWRSYSDATSDIAAFTGETPHNTITPVARKNKDGQFELDLVLRNNKTTLERPYGMYHPRESLHHIKKENIGLIEVLGLAILPGRLQQELKTIEQVLAGGVSFDAMSDSFAVHAPWVEELVQLYGVKNNPEKAAAILQEEVGKKFVEVLADCGVYSRTPEGMQGFDRFMESCGFMKD